MNVLRDTGIVFVRQMRPTLRNPVAVIVFGMLQPVLYLALFGPLLSGMPGPSGAASWEWFVPGIVVMLGLFGTAFAGFGLLPELRSGAHERLLATSVSRVALLLGRVSRDVVVLLVQAVLVIAVVTALGLRVSPLGVAAGLLLLAVLGIGLGILSYVMAMLLRQEYLFAGLLQTVIMPLILLSGVLLPMDMAPGWLSTISRANPISHVVDAERALFAGDLTEPAVLVGTGVAVAIALIAVVLGTRSMRRVSA
ncbi:ABC-2 type transport system permease protein [Spinactinospora alkalitolerans]|uniref:Transport permease protein n=1 Tax=Spinactinospora alkalitolerans TaxID=687207 RepID=A0A852U059_9ACTN|nr:ABC transporter permease [Spinactinospora alkalitolerans]NYE48927.1 ABC-2 type transport system permease protein [Spinactinospora alkalitolerans]